MLLKLQRSVINVSYPLRSLSV